MKFTKIPVNALPDVQIKFTALEAMALCRYLGVMSIPDTMEVTEKAVSDGYITRSEADKATAILDGLFDFLDDGGYNSQ
jgi:hypothetical protein